MIINRWVCVPIISLALVTLLIVGSREQARAGEKLPIERIWALEERTEGLEQRVLELNGKIEMMIVAVDRVEEAIRKNRDGWDDSKVTGEVVGRVQQLIRPMARDIAALKSQTKTMQMRVVALDTKESRRSLQVEKRGLISGNGNTRQQGNIEPIESAAFSGEGSVGDHPSDDQSAGRLTHWLTESSGVRHNAKCEWYQKSNGHLVGPEEGRACTRCGG